MQELAPRLDELRGIDLAQPYYSGMPHHANHAPFLHGPNKAPGEATQEAVGPAPRPSAHCVGSRYGAN